jgi:hypothetical protein
MRRHPSKHQQCPQPTGMFIKKRATEMYYHTRPHVCRGPIRLVNPEMPKSDRNRRRLYWPHPLLLLIMINDLLPSSFSSGEETDCLPG